MFAPQYPDGLRMDIYSYKLEGGNQGQDIKEINVLNHYIGMKRPRWRKTSPSSSGCPSSSARSACSSCARPCTGRWRHLVDVIVLFVYFAAFSLWSFGYKLYSYGHNLAPTAAVKVPPFMPPMFGYKQLANFEVYSYPQAAAYALAAVGVLLLAAFGDRVADRTSAANAGVMTTGARLVAGSPRLIAQGSDHAVRSRHSRGPARGPLPRRRSRRASTRRAPGDDARGRPRGATGAICSSISRYASSAAAVLSCIGSGAGSVIRIRAPHVTVEGFDIDGRSGGDLGRDSSGIHVAAPGATIRDCRIRNALFGIYLREAPGGTHPVLRDPRHSRPAPGEKGSGIHVWNTDGFRLIGNNVVDARDGFYIQSSPHGFIVAQRRHATCATACTTCSPTTTCSRTTGSRTGDAGTALDVLEAHHVPAQPLRAQPRFRVGRPALQGLRRCAGGRQPDCRQRAGDLPRGLVSQHRFAATSSPSPTRPSCCTTRASRSASRATRSSRT